MPSYNSAEQHRRRKRLKQDLLQVKHDIRPRVRGPSFNRLVPNLLTMLGLFAGLTALRFSLAGRFDQAVIALLIAACIDGLDGRIARLLHGTSRFGAEFDSLSDFLCFGVTPGFILFLWSLQEHGRYGYMPCAFFTICMALRLARFNASLDDTEQKPKYAGNFFTGVPAPAGAGLVLFPVFLGLEGHRLDCRWMTDFSHNPIFVTAVLVCVAILMISTLPVWSFKNFKIPASFVLPLMLGTGICAAAVVADPWGTLVVACIIYVLMLPFSRRSYLKLRLDAEALQEEIPDELLPSEESAKNPSAHP